MARVAAAATVFAAVGGSGCTSPTVDLPAPPGEDAVRPVVAVSRFENRSGFSGQWKLGRGMADLLVSELVASSHFVVVERRHLERVLRELDMQATEYFRKQGRADHGRLKNVQYFIRGVITDFTQVASGELEAAWDGSVLGFSGYTARVALTLTVVDVESGEIVSSISSDGYAEAGGPYGEGEYKHVRFGGDAFFRTPLGIATRNAVRKAIQALVKDVDKRRWHPHIARVDGDRIVVTGGRKHDQKAGMTYRVLEQPEAVTDPATGDQVGKLPGPQVGRIRIEEVREKMAIARPVEGGPFRRGQRLKPAAGSRSNTQSASPIDAE